MRYSLGDIPFRDEVLNPLRWFDILLWPLIHLLPEQYNILALRYTVLIFHFFCLGTLLYSLRRFMPFIVSAAVFGAVCYMNYALNTWMLTYHSMAADFISLFLGLWFIGLSSVSFRRAGLFGGAAGLALFLAAFCELPLVVLLSVPVMLLAVSVKKSGFRGCASICGSSLVASTVLLSAVAFACLYAAGLFPDFVRAMNIQMTIGAYGESRLLRLVAISKSMSAALPLTAYHAGICLVVILIIVLYSSRLRAHPWAASAIVAAILAADFLFSFSCLCTANTGLFSLLIGSNYIEGLSLFAILFYPAAYILGKRFTSDNDMMLVSSLFFTSILLKFVLGVITGTGLLVGTVMSLPLQFLLLVIVICRVTSGAEYPIRKNIDSHTSIFPRVAITAFCLCTAAVFTAAYLHGLQYYNTSFKHGKLRGIYFEAEKIDRTEQLLEYLEPRVHRGDLLLSFYNNPMLNYLTETRPALATGYPNQNWPAETLDLFVKQMVSRGRVPHYAVSMGRLRKDPVFLFVYSNFSPVKKIGPFIVWENKDISSPARQPAPPRTSH